MLFVKNAANTSDQITDQPQRMLIGDVESIFQEFIKKPPGAYYMADSQLLLDYQNG